MPWESKTIMQQREAFVAAAMRKEASMSALCQQYEISRKTGYKWLNRAQEGRPLCDQSRRPNQQPSKTAPEIESLILAVRADHPSWGGRMIKAVLEVAGYEGLPSAKTCGNILKRNGCISPEESRKHRPYQRFQREKCNQLWQADFKGDFLLGDGTRCYPLTILDDHSRYCLRIEAKLAATGIIQSFQEVFEEHGLPDAILTDNGAQFSGFRGGYTRFERWLMDLNILPLHGRIMHPQTQGKIERFHRTLKQDVLQEVLADQAAAQKRFLDWRWFYNEMRPHSALGMKPPGAVYHPSTRCYHSPEPFEYPLGSKVVKVNNWGYLRFGPIRLYLSETMANTYLEIRGTDSDGLLVIYRNFKIAEIDAVNQQLRNRHIRKL